MITPLSTEARINVCDRIIALRALAAQLRAEGFTVVADNHQEEINDLLALLVADQDAQTEAATAKIRSGCLCTV